MDAVSADLEAANPNFRAELPQSQVAVHAVVDWLISRGHEAKSLELVISPDVTSRAAFSDDGDLRYKLKGTAAWCTGEVKHRQMDFTSANDYPYQKIIVDAKIKVEDRDAGKRDTAAWFLVNKSKSHAAIIRWSSRPQWELFQGHDRRLNRSRYFYICPLQFVEFRPLINC